MPKNHNLNVINENESISLQIDDNYYPSRSGDNYDKFNNNKPLTYDDMLASMCMRVQNGNLCMMMKDDDISNNYGDVIEPPQLLNRRQQQQQQQVPRPVSTISANTMNNNSYIYNKYFQKYKQNDQPVDDVSELKNLLLSGQISREDYKKAVLIKLINDRNEKLRLQKIKSKKMMFSNSNINISGANRGQAPANMNKLFRFAGPGPLPYKM
jgi:hypothetical protein